MTALCGICGIETDDARPVGIDDNYACPQCIEGPNLLHAIMGAMGSLPLVTAGTTITIASDDAPDEGMPGWRGVDMLDGTIQLTRELAQPLSAGEAHRLIELLRP